MARSIARLVRRGEARYKDCAVLYRTNAQSRLFEEKFIAANIPYKIVGGVNFYARKEIKDILAYLKTIDNGHDDLAVKRIINVPKRRDDDLERNSQSTYRKAKEAFKKTPTYGTEYATTFNTQRTRTPVYTPVSNQKSFASANTTGGLSYKVGDRVSHIKFGAGEVMAIVEGGRDYEVTVDFDKAGTKKMFASFAKLKKID